MTKQLLNTFRITDNRYLEKINTLDISDFTGDQVARAIKIIDDDPRYVWEFQKIEEV